jgi:hypothetical protein
MVPAQLANLRPPFKGKPGPGRPKGSLDFNNRIKKALLSQIKAGQFKGQQIIDVFVEVMKRQLLKGDVQWAKFIIERLEPMMTDARQALGVQVNINAGQPSALDIDVSGERLASIQRIMRECRIIDVTPESVIVVNPGIEHGHSGNGNGKP